MLLDEFEIKYNQILYAQIGVPKTDEQIKENNARKKLFWKSLQHESLGNFSDAIDRACEMTEYFPKLSAVKALIDEINASKHVSSGGSKSYQSAFEWIDSITVEDAKYYGHKLTNPRERNIILKKLQRAGIPDFEPIDNCPGFQRFQTFLRSEEWKNKRFGRLEDIERREKQIERGEYDDSGYADPKALEYIGVK